MLPLRLVLNGAPRTKKNHGRIVPRGGAHIMLPSKQWEAWCKQLAPQLRASLESRGIAPITRSVNCRALFYRDALRGDAVGFFQGLADLLQHGGVVSDDKWIRAWDGSRLLKDATRPRVELELTAIGD